MKKLAIKILVCILTSGNSTAMSIPSPEDKHANIQLCFKSVNEMVENFISQGGDVQALDNIGFAVIHYAILAGDTEALATIVKHNRNAINTLTHDKMSPLDIAIYTQNVSITSLLSKIGAKTRYENLEQALHNPELIKALLPYTHSLVNVPNGTKILADYDYKDFNADVISFLIDKGADVDANKGDEVPFFFRFAQHYIGKDWSLIGKVINASKNFSLIHYLVLAEDAESLLDLLEKNPKVIDKKDKISALDISVCMENVLITKILTIRKAKVSYQNLEQSLHNPELLKALLPYSYSLTNIENGTEILANYPFKYYDEEIISFLIRRGADVDVKKYEGTSFLYQFAQRYEGTNEKFIDRVIGASQNIDAQYDWGHTALSVAILWKHFDIANGLLKAGANPNIRDRIGFSAKDLAKLYDINIVQTNTNKNTFFLTKKKPPKSFLK